MKIGLIGMGSIGCRHARVLAALGERDLVALRTGRGAARTLPEDLSLVAEEWDEDRFWATPLDGVIVATPTTMHASALARAAARGLRCFVEKPLTASLSELPVLDAAARARVIVGFCLRFHPLIRRIHTFLSAEEGSRRLGRVYKARLYFGSYLPGWHPTTDYRKSYASRRDLGGGVLRTISHELDLVQHLLGPIDAISGEVRRASDLELDVDDSVMLACRTRTGASALVELDYLNPVPTRCGSFIGAQGRLDYAFTPPSLRLIAHGGTTESLLEGPKDALDEMYRAQMLDFLGFLRGQPSEACSYEDAIAVMRTIEAAEQLAPRPVSDEPAR